MQFFSDARNRRRYDADINSTIDLETISLAAQEDCDSGALDEFLFKENKIVATPFENLIESRARLEASQNQTRLVNQINREKQKFIKIEGRLRHLTQRLRYREDLLHESQNDLASQVRILDGELSGVNELNWKDSPKGATSLFGMVARANALTLVVLPIGLIEMFVVWTTLSSFLSGNEWEAIALSIPGVGIQLVFPHLIGEALRNAKRGLEVDKSSIVENLLLAFAWLIFLGLLTFVRVNHVNQTHLLNTSKNLSPTTFVSLVALNFLILFGLGTVILIRSAAENPHLREMYRLELQVARIHSKLKRLRRRIIWTESRLETTKSEISLLEEDLQRVSIVVPNLWIDAARDAYRRSLVNSFGDVEFTNAYLNKDKFTKES